MKNNIPYKLSCWGSHIAALVVRTAPLDRALGRNVGILSSERRTWNNNDRILAGGALVSKSLSSRHFGIYALL